MLTTRLTLRLRDRLRVAGSFTQGKINNCKCTHIRKKFLVGRKSKTKKKTIEERKCLPNFTAYKQTRIFIVVICPTSDPSNQLIPQTHRTKPLTLSVLLHQNGTRQTIHPLSRVRVSTFGRPLNPIARKIG